MGMTVYQLQNGIINSAPAFESMIVGIVRGWRLDHRLRDESPVCCQDALLRLRFDLAAEARVLIAARGGEARGQVANLGQLIAQILPGLSTLCGRCYARGIPASVNLACRDS